MLERLRLESFVILSEAEIAFGKGLNAVTGETGTGKSILIDAIGFLAGGRGDTDWIREGAGSLMVEGLFNLERLPAAAAMAERLSCAPQSGRIHLRRELGRGGKGKAWIQGRNARLSDLRALGECCLAIHAQGEHRRLLDPAVQLDLADRFAGCLPERDAYAAARTRWRDLAGDLDASRRRLEDLLDKEEWHRFQLEEIDRAGVSPGEEAALRERRIAAASGRRSAEARDDLEAGLFEQEGSCADRLESALHGLGGLGDEWRPFREEIVAAREALRRARRLVPASEAAEEDLDAIDERLALLSRLRKKYGASEDAILARRAAVAGLLEETDRLRLAVSDLAREAERAREAASSTAQRLHSARVRAAPALGRAVTNELRDLGMSGAALDLVLETEEAGSEEGLPMDGEVLRAFADGVDRGYLRLRPNPGEGAGPLASVASGGELSRSLLALLAVLGGREEPRTAIFDEVDAGVGGATAAAVARRLEILAATRQVLLVTHLPLIACRAEEHLRVEKTERAGRTHARVSPLDREGRIGELARMLAGEMDSVIARKHAEALLSGPSPAAPLRSTRRSATA